MRQLIMLIAALIFGGCASLSGGSGVDGKQSACSKYPCEWSKPVVKGKTGIPKPDYSDAVKAYLCTEPTRAYPVMPAVNCI